MNNYCIIDSYIDFHHRSAGITTARHLRIGGVVSIFQHVTITESDKDKTTVMEDNVRIGAVLLNPLILIMVRK